MLPLEVTRTEMQPIRWLSFVFFICAIFLLHYNLYAQAPKIEWQQCYGGIHSDLARSIVPANSNLDDNYIIVGFSNDVPCNYTHSGAVIGWVASVNRSGTSWQRCLGGSNGADLRSVTRTFDGGYAIAGFTNSNDGDVSGNHGGEDAWVVKLDSNGNILWQKCFGGSSADEAFSIIETSDEERDLVIAGNTNSTDGDVSGWHIDTNKSDLRSSDIWVVRMSSTGIIKWQKCLGGSRDDRGYSVIQTVDGGFAVAGTTWSDDGDVSGNHGWYDGWVIKLDPNGNIEWQKCFGGSRTDEAWSIIQTSDSGYAIAGYTTSHDGDSYGNHIPDTNKNSMDIYYDTSDVFVVKLSALGKLEWQKCFGGSFDDLAFSIAQTSKNDFVVAGETNSNDGDINNYHGKNGSKQSLILHIGSTGNLKWARCFGGTAQDNPAGYGDFASSILQTPDDGYVFGGATMSVDGDIHGANHGQVNGWVVKLEPDSVVAKVDYSSDIENYVDVYPNPAATELHFSTTQNFSLTGVSFFDIMGRQHFPNYTLENNSISCDVHNLSSGIYMARLTLRSNYPGILTLPFIVQH